MKKEKPIKVGDSISCEYKFGKEWFEGIGYIYNTGSKGDGVLMAGISCKNGGVGNDPLDQVRNVKLLKL